MKSHRVERKVPDGTNYEAMEGARAGSAVREVNCQVLSNCGGAAVRIPKLTSAGKVFARVKSGADEIGSMSGDGSDTRSCSDLYSDFSAEQQPLSQECELGLLAGAVV